MDNQQMQELALKLADLSSELDLVEARKKELNGQYDTVSAELLQQMNAAGFQNFKTDRGTFYINTSVYPKIVDTDKAFNLLRELGVGGIIKETVHAQTLRSTYRELMEAGKIDIFSAEAAGIVTHTEESVRLRKG